MCTLHLNVSWYSSDPFLASWLLKTTCQLPKSNELVPLVKLGVTSGIFCQGEFQSCNIDLGRMELPIYLIWNKCTGYILRRFHNSQMLKLWRVEYIELIFFVYLGILSLCKRGLKTELIGSRPGRRGCSSRLVQANSGRFGVPGASSCWPLGPGGAVARLRSTQLFLVPEIVRSCCCSG